MNHQRFATAAGIVLLVLLTACAHSGIRGTEPEVRRVAFGEGELEVHADIGDADATRLAQMFAGQGMRHSAVWNVPGVPDLQLAIIEREPEGDSYGPQLVAFRVVDGAPSIVQESSRLFDDDFVYPTFFRFADRTFLLADHGSEDAYGSIAWSFENDSVRDLGELPIALPEDEGVFTRGVAQAAHVELRGSAYAVRIDGPVLLYPREQREQTLARWGNVTFREVDGKLQRLQ